MTHEHIPEELRDRAQWLLWDSNADTPRRPHWRGDFGISWSDPDDWHAYEDAVEAAKERDSWGIGYVTALESDDYARGLYGVIDIDGGLVDGELAEWVIDLDKFEDAYIERSPSGEGLHIPFVGNRPPEWWSDSHFDEHTGVDVLTNKFCTFTGDVYNEGDVYDGNPAAWLHQAYKEINDEAPRINTEDTDEYDGDGELTEEQVREALDHVDADLHYTDWLNVAMAVYDWDDGSTGKRLFEQWSQSNPKWDKKHGQHHIDDIWSGSPNGNVSVGTLVYHAKEGGWAPPAPDGGAAATAPVQSLADRPDGPDIEETAAIDLDPLSVTERAGYDPDEVDLADLRNDELAYTVAEMIDASDDVYMRWTDDNSRLFAYDDGVWTNDGEKRLREVLHRALRHRNSKTMHGEAGHAIKSRPTLKISREYLGAPEGTVAAANGLLDLRDRTIRDLEPHDFALNQINVEFDPEAEYEGTRWMEFLEESVRNDDLEALQEYAGYTLWHHAQPFGKALFIVGPTDAGKGVFLDVIEEILGDKNVASQSLYELMQSRWGVAELFGKMANIRNEVTASGLKNVEKFKEMTGGGDRISAERKGQDPFKFKVTQKFMFSTNQVPSVEQAGKPFFNRLLFVKFPNTVSEEEQNPDLSDTLLEERSAILNWMVDGLERLLANGQFSGERSVDAKRDIADAWGSLVDRFKHNLIEVTGNLDDVVHKADLYDLFNEYGEYLGKPDEVPQSTFTKTLKSEPGISDGQSRRVDGEEDRPHVYKGIRVNQTGIEEMGVDDPRHAHDDNEESGQQRF